MMTREYDFAVIGGGVIGGLIARELSRFEVRTVILERCMDVSMGASKANSGIVHAGFDAERGTLKARMNVRGSELMETVASELGVGYRRNGSVVTAFSDKEREHLLRLAERGARNGVKDISVIDGDRLREFEPNLSPEIKYALYAPTGAIISPYGLCIAAVGNAMDNGCDLMRGFEVTAVERSGEWFTVTSSTGEAIRCRAVINAAGINSDIVASMASPARFRILPRKGEYLLCDKELGGMVGCTVFGCPTEKGKGVLVTPTVDGNLLLGPTAEDVQDRDDVATCADGLSYVERSALRQLPRLPRGKVITSFAGLRAKADGGDFIIEWSERGFLNVAGIDSPGLSSAPAIAETVVDMIGNSGFRLDRKRNFDPFRKPLDWFSRLSDEEKSEVIRERPEYGHIVCRCEKISEGEIRDAIRRDPRPHDTDGIKRRTRSGMGRCQGGFCLPRVAEILSEETGIPFLEITKASGGSYINKSRTKGD